MGTGTDLVKKLAYNLKITEFQKKELLRRSLMGKAPGALEDRSMSQLGSNIGSELPQEVQLGRYGFTQPGAEVPGGIRTEVSQPPSRFQPYPGGGTVDEVRNYQPPMNQGELPGIPQSLPGQYTIDPRASEMRQKGGQTLQDEAGAYPGNRLLPGQSGPELNEPVYEMPGKSQVVLSRSPGYTRDMGPYPRTVQKAGEIIEPTSSDVMYTRGASSPSGEKSQYDRLKEMLPPRDVKLGRVSKTDAEGNLVTRDLPIEEARALVKSDPRWRPEPTPKTTGGVLKTSRVESDSPENMIPEYAKDRWDHGVKVERLKWTSVLTKEEKDTAAAIKRTIEEMHLDLQPEEVQTLTEKFIEIRKEMMGSGRGAVAKHLDSLRKTGLSKNNPKIKDSKDYFNFIASMKYDNRLSPNYSREFKAFDQMLENAPIAREKWNKIISERGK